jgi:hypothetical protein
VVTFLIVTNSIGLVADIINNVSEISSFGEDRDGEIYVVSLKGKIYKIVAGQ